MQKGNKKILLIIIIGIIILIYGAIILVLSNNNQNNNPTNGNNNGSNNNEGNLTPTKNYEVLIVNNHSIWKNSDNVWSSIDNIDDFNEKFIVYINKNYFGEYYLKFVNKWNLLNDNKKIVTYDGKILAYSLDLNIDVKNFNIENNTYVELDEINEIIGYSISLEDLSVNEKIILDLDSDNISDKIVNVSNLDSENQECYFNLCYAVLNGNIKVLFYNIVEEEDLLVEPIYYLQYVLNINNDKYDSIILQESYFSNSGKTSNVMYKYNGLNYLKEISD